MVIEAVRAAGRRVAMSQGPRWGTRPRSTRSLRAAAMAGTVAVDGTAGAADITERAFA
ncbi:hypothetical protein ACMHYB_08680 [Sorangium sp. So ce1128]